MNRFAQRGLTLIEMLVSITVMMILLAAAHATVRESMKMHKGSFRDSARTMHRCDLAEQLTADFRMNLGMSEATAAQWTLTRRDGSVVEYRLEEEKVTRSMATDEKIERKTWDIGPVTVAFLGKGPDWLDKAPRAGETRALRLRFGGSELIVAK